MNTQNDNTDLENKLFNKLSLDPPEREDTLLIEQYKIYIELADNVSERRLQTSTYFLTVNTAVLTILAGFLGFAKETKASYSWVIIPAIAGIVLCYAWHRLIKSYRQLNTGKFKIIHLLDTHLPANLFKAEWDVLNHGDGTVYTQFTKTEIWVPWVFISLYAFLA